MAVSDVRQRFMPTSEDRLNGQVLGYKEAVLLTNPSNPEFKGEVINIILLITMKLNQVSCI